MTIEQTNEIDILPAARPTNVEAIGQLMAHAEAMGAAKKLADALCATDMVPADYKNKPGNGAAAILYGAELGLNPIQSLQQIFVVHGRPAIYARTAVALVKRQGVVIETVESTDVSVTVRGRDTRTGQVEEATWTIERAKQAGYTKNAKYQSNPQEMLWAKAAMEVARRVAPDVLLGIPYSVEDLTVGPPMQVRAERVDMGQRTLNALREKAAHATPVTVEVSHDNGPPGGQSPPAPDHNKVLRRMHVLFGKADIAKDNRADRLTVTRAIVGRIDPPIESSNDLTTEEAEQLVVQLSAWDDAGDLGAQVTEILNAATLTEVETN